MRHQPVICRLALLLLVIGAAAAARLLAPAVARAQPLIPEVFRVYFTDTGDLRRLARDLDVWEVHHDAGYLVAPLTPEQVAVLQPAHRIEPAPAPPAWPAGTAENGRIPGFACYRTVEETYATLTRLAARYPRLAALTTLGPSWDKQQPGGPTGYDLKGLVLTNQDRSGPKFRFFLMGAIHARELVTSETVTRFAERLLAGYGTDPDATWLLDYGELHLLPIANPDGRKQAEAGILWRKNTNSDAACELPPPFAGYGVDLNRNSTFQWNSCEGCSSADSCAQTYRGVAPGSEPETQAIERYVAGLFADRRGPAPDAAAPSDTGGLFISLHSYGREVLFPWGWSDGPAPNQAGLQTLARKFGFYLGASYQVCQSGAVGCIYPTDGTTDDWAYGALGVAAYTFELGDWFFESCSVFEGQIVEPTLAALTYGFRAARLPYRWPAGPEVVNVTVTPSVVTAGERVTVTATADDTRSSGGIFGSEPVQPITAARLTVDLPPWLPGSVGVAMGAQDGQLDNPVERLKRRLDTACWPGGRHLLFVQARDAGHWGAPAAQFVDVRNDPGFSASPVSPATATAPVTPVSFAVAITNTGTVSAAYILEAGSSPWTLEVPAGQVGPLAPGEMATVRVRITPPAGAAELARSRLVVRDAAETGRCLHVDITTTLRMPELYLPIIPVPR